MRVFNGHTSWVRSVLVDGDTLVSASDDKTIRRWNKHTGDCVRILNGHTDFVVSVVVDRYTLVSASRDKTIRIWNKHTGDCVRVLKGHANSIVGVVVDGEALVSVSYDNTIRIWNISGINKFEQFITELPLPYFCLLYKLDTVTNSASWYTRLLYKLGASQNKATLSVDDREVLNHFLETIKENWGEPVMQAVQQELQKYHN